MSRATAGSSPSLTRTPAVVWGTYRWHMPSVQPDSRTAASTSAVTSLSSVRREVLTTSVRVNELLDRCASEAILSQHAITRGEDQYGGTAVTRRAPREDF